MAKLERPHFFKVRSGKITVWCEYSNKTERISNSVNCHDGQWNQHMYRYLHRVGHPYFVLPILCQCFKKIHIFKNFAVKKCQDKFTNISVLRSSLFNFDTSLSKLVVTTSQRSNLKKIIHLAPPIIGLNIFFRAFSFWLFFSNFHKTCSCPLVKYFCTLFWDDIMMIWDDNIVYFF